MPDTNTNVNEASVIIKRDTKANIDLLPRVNGQMLWTIDSGQDNHIYNDILREDGTVERIQIGGILPETEAEIQQAVTDASASATSASTSATNASASATNASNSATEAQSYAKGGTGTRTGENTDNAKYYKEQADVDATNASSSATSASTSATNASASATQASTSATNASNSAILAESYTKGGTGTRTGEDTDNAEYYKEQARIYAESASQGIQPATPSAIGGVKPDNHTIVVDGVGTITAQEVQEITESDFNALVTKDPKVAYFVKSSTSGATGRIWYNDSWFGGTDVTISVDNITILKDSNDVISVNEFVGTKAQATQGLSNIPDGATVYTTDESSTGIVVDTVLNTSSNNPIANSTVATKFNQVDTAITDREYKRTLVTTTLASTDWSNGEYSFESTYPNTTYDLEQIQPYGTVDQLKAWGKAIIVGNSSGNTIIARGTVPTVDIPIMMYVRRK